ncbi:MAG: hypothetical protein ACI9NN_001863, partial [Bacteroidia bacterium]
MKKTHIALFVLLSFFGYSTSLAQNIQNLYTLDWQEHGSSNFAASNFRNFKNCSYAVFNDEALPYYFIKGNAVGTPTSFAISNAKYEDINASTSFKAAVELAIQTSFQKNFYTTEKGQNYLNFKILPYRINPTTDQLERLMSFELKTVMQGEPLPRTKLGKAGSFTAQSLLSSGDWYKFKV